jgi:hypothetical protein
VSHEIAVVFSEKCLIFGSGQIADAEPVLPGWRLAVDQIFA